MCPSPQNRRAHEGGLEQPEGMYYAEQKQSHNNRTRLGELRQAPNKVFNGFNEDERFVEQNDVRCDKVDNVYAHDLRPQPRRRSEKVLPSIERDLHEEHNEPATLYEKTRQVNPFGSYQSQPNRGLQQLPMPSIINLDDDGELPSSKRRRLADQQPVNSYGHTRTVLVPIEQIGDRQPRYERPYEAAYHDDMGHFVSDKRIVPLPRKEARARSPMSRQEFHLSSPQKHIQRHWNQVPDRVERYPQPRDHYQIPLSRSEKVDDSKSPSRAVFALPEYYNDSLSFSGSSQFAPRRRETSDLGFPSRHNVSVISNTDNFYADSQGMTRRLQPLDVAEPSMPSRFSDMSIDYRQHEDDQRPDRAAYLPSTTTSNFHRYTDGSTGALPYPLQ